MNLFDQLLAWFSNPVNWTGATGVPTRLFEHLYISIGALLIGFVVALPVGVLIGHTGRGSFLIVGVANGMRALPELGLLILLVQVLYVGLLPVYIALAILAIPPVMAGAYAGVRNVDPAIVDAARGVGMREREVLLKVELPNALPLILGGARSAALQIVATAAIAAYVSAGGFGRYLFDGLRVRDYPQMAAGAVLVALLALTVEGVLAILQRSVVSPGLRATGGARRSPTAELVQSDTETITEDRSPAPQPAGVER